MKKQIFRASYSILNSWSRGYAQDAINMYFKLDREPNKFMIAGRKYHKEWEDYIIKNNKMHPQLSSGNRELKDPQCELKLEMPINKHIELVGVIDCLDEHTIYEFKSGSYPSSQYANGKQVDIYSLLTKYHGYDVTKAFYLHFDQYIRETDSALVWITPERTQKAKEWVINVAEEMHNYLLNNGLYEKYPKPEKS